MSKAITVKEVDYFSCLGCTLEGKCTSRSISFLEELGLPRCTEGYVYVVKEVKDEV
jgi:hypothetical protein